jgi:hypothetical protein
MSIQETTEYIRNNEGVAAGAMILARTAFEEMYDTNGSDAGNTEILRELFVTAFVFGYVTNINSGERPAVTDIEAEIRKAYAAGQGNGQMMDSGLERSEADEYVMHNMARIKKSSAEAPNASSDYIAHTEESNK